MHNKSFDTVHNNNAQKYFIRKRTYFQTFQLVSKSYSNDIVEEI